MTSPRVLLALAIGAVALVGGAFLLLRDDGGPPPDATPAVTTTATGTGAEVPFDVGKMLADINAQLNRSLEGPGARPLTPEEVEAIVRSQLPPGLTTTTTTAP